MHRAAAGSPWPLNVPARNVRSPIFDVLLPRLSGSAAAAMPAAASVEAEHGCPPHDGVEPDDVRALVVLAREVLHAADVRAGPAHGDLQRADARAARRVDEVERVGDDRVAVADVGEDAVVLARSRRARRPSRAQRSAGARCSSRGAVAGAQRLGELPTSADARPPRAGPRSLAASW